jgi:hypothetical protein
VTSRSSKSLDIALRYARLRRINAMRNLRFGLQLWRRRMMSKFAETAAANLSLQRLMFRPDAPVSADDVEPFFAISATLLAGTNARMSGCVYPFPHRESHARRPLARLKKRKPL